MHQRSPRAVGVLGKRQSATSPDYLSCETEKREERELGAKRSARVRSQTGPFRREVATAPVISSARPPRASSPRSQWTISSPRRPISGSSAVLLSRRVQDVEV